MSNNEMKVLITGDASSAMATLEQFTSKVFSSVDHATGGFGKLALGVGGVAGVAEKMTEKIMEGMKEIASFVPEASAHVNELARTFEGLSFQTGEGLHTLNVFDATMKLTGGTLEQLEGWLTGVTRSMKSNSEVFVANGIAANQAALMQMKPIDVMRGALEVVENETDQMKKLVLAQEMLGRGAIAELPQMRRLFETMGEGTEILQHYGAEIDQTTIEQMKRMEISAGKTAIAMDKLQKETAKDYEGVNSFFGMVNRSLLTMADYSLKAFQGIGPLMNSIMGGVNAAFGISPTYGQEEQVSGSAHDADRTRVGPKAKTKEQLEAEKVAAKNAAEEAKKAKEVLNALQEQSNKLEDESYKSMDNATVAQRKQREEAEALGKLQEEYRKADRELEKAHTPENEQAAFNVRAAAYQAYTDQLLFIKRKSDVDLAKEEEAAKQKAIEDLKKEMAEMAQIKGGLTDYDQNAILGRYSAAGGARAGAADKYRQEQHLGEGAFAGVQGGMNAFLATQENTWNKWKGFTTGILNGAQSAFSNFFMSLTEHGGSAMDKLEALAKGLAQTLLKSLADMGAAELLHWGIQKAKTAWTIGAGVAEKTASVAGTAATTTSLVAESTAMGVATAAAIDLAAAESWAAYAAIPFVGAGLALGQIATMLESMATVSALSKASIVAHAKGGVIDHPMLALMGETDETEIVANETSFKDWGNAQTNLGYNLAAHDAQLGRLQSQASSYGSAAAQQGPGGGGASHNYAGAVFVVASSRQWAEMVQQGQRTYGRANG